MVTEVIIKKWGNSFGVILPKEIVDRQHLKVNQKIGIQVFQKADLRDLFGSLPRDVSGQRFKDDARKGWK